MSFKNLTEQLETKGMPIFWQFYISLGAILSFMIFFIRDDNWLHIINLAIHFLIFFGIIAGYRSHNQKNYPRLILVSGAGLIVVAKTIQSSIYLGFPIDPNISFIIEEQGIALITIFAFIHMIMFEEKFNIKGLAIDYSLLETSA